MRRSRLPSVARQLLAVIPDADLLERYVECRADDAFAQLVTRYSRLVWGQCRNLLPDDADADDAFQATFLTLARSAKSIRAGAPLGPWLHGVAYRVCQNARRAMQRRAKREKACAIPEADRPIADSAWEVAFAAVSEEVQKLPESQRTAFVLCCIEGRATTEAAASLGQKLGTFSARLTRAKQTLLDRLAKRGVGAGVLALGGVTGSVAVAPAALIERTLALIPSGVVVPGSVQILMQGVTGMTMIRIKLLAAGVMIATGFGLSVGGGWSGEAAAQNGVPPGGASGLPAPRVDPPKSDPNLEKLKAELQKAKAELAKAEAEVDAKVRENFQQRLLLAWGATREAPKFEYEPLLGKGLTTQAFEAKLAEREKGGWEFLGQVTFDTSKETGLGVGKDGTTSCLVFRKKPIVNSVWTDLNSPRVVPVPAPPAVPKVAKPTDPVSPAPALPPAGLGPVWPGAALPTPPPPGGKVPVKPLPTPGSPPPPGSGAAPPNAIGGLGGKLARFENAVLEKFQGSWRLTGWELAGGKLTAEEMKVRDDVMVIEGNNFTYLDKGQKVYFGRIAVDSTQDPPTLLLLGTDRKQDMYTWCIYELDGDTLRICKDVKGKGRPTEFKATENTVIQSYRRTK